MRSRSFVEGILVAIISIGFSMIPSISFGKEVIQEWELINPEGAVEIKAVKPASRLTTLEGKTIVLRWNGKHNGDNFLNRIAELLAEKVPSAKVIKLYEVDKSTVRTIGSRSEVARTAKVIKDLKADIVIGSQAD